MLEGRWTHEVRAGVAAVRDAVSLASAIQREIPRDGLVKADRSPVTVADFSVQALVIHRLMTECPGDAVVAEEDSSGLRSAGAEAILGRVIDCVRRRVPAMDAERVWETIDRGAGVPGDRFWTLDPIDGTKGFVRGEHYAIALALIVDGRVEIGILGCPHLALAPATTGSLAVAVRGQGAFAIPLTGEGITPIQVSGIREAAVARLVRSRDPGHIDASRLDRFVERLGAAAAPVPMDSQAKHAALAAGQADLMLRLPLSVEFRESIWDQAAGSLVIEEAGGRVTDLNGAPLDFGAGRTLARNTGVVASNGWLHQAALEAVRS